MARRKISPALIILIGAAFIALLSLAIQLRVLIDNWRRMWLPALGVFGAAAGVWVLLRVLLRHIPWHRLPNPPDLPGVRLFNLGIAALARIRDQLRAENLFDTASAPQKHRPIPDDPKNLYARTPSGVHNDSAMASMGSAGMPFGRNVPLERVAAFAGADKRLHPDPFVVSRRLLTRDKFIPAESLNLLAAGWIQFQVHDWFHHKDAKTIRHLDLPEGSGFPDNKMSFPETEIQRTIRTESGDAPVFENDITHWWDASQLYGSDAVTLERLRVGPYLKIGNDDLRLLPLSDDGLDDTGFNKNWWLGLCIFHTLFALEHNAIADHLKKHYPAWDNEHVFQTARLINSGLMAKIHTWEWTTAVLATPTLKLAMTANWWGILGRRWHQVLGRFIDNDVLCGIPGSPTDQHGVPYAMTEEFVSVYRMHPLLPDEYKFYNVSTGAGIGSLSLEKVQHTHTREAVLFAGDMPNVIYSFGIANPGAITLHNYPGFLQHFKSVRGDSEFEIDLGAVDIYRDRERGLPRYNEFRQLLHLKRLKSIKEMGDPKLASEIADLYGGYDKIDDVDLMVGLLSEKPPKGFAFSDTAFRIFILMASRRLKSDRFYTNDYRTEIYTKEGLEWIDQNGLGSVLIRHYPELRGAINEKNPFVPWRPVV